MVRDKAIAGMQLQLVMMPKLNDILLENCYSRTWPTTQSVTEHLQLAFRRALGSRKAARLVEDAMRSRDVVLRSVEEKST